jgi:dihydroorotase
MIDVHVHLRDGRQAAKETILHGLQVASALGITAVCDMPNTDPPLTHRLAVLDRLALGAQAVAQLGKEFFYGVYLGVTADDEQLCEVVDLYRELSPQVVGLKLFAGHSTGNMGLTTEEQQQQVYRQLAHMGYTGVLAVHCEKESLMHPELWDPQIPESHLLARPPEAEIASVSDQITFARQAGFPGTLHICHISTEKAIALVADAQKHGMRITCGATAHHALLDEHLAKTPGHLCKMNPPLRCAADRDAVFSALCDGTIDWIESDHAPHTLVDKAKGASGVPGFAGTALLIRALRHAGVSEDHMKRLCGERAAEVFHLSSPVKVPDERQIHQIITFLRKSYPYDSFATIGNKDN